MKALEKIRQAAGILKDSHVQQSMREAELIVMHCLGIDNVILYREDPFIPGETMSRIDEMLQRRKQREPLQYIFGTVDFWGLTIHVGPSVLIPRPETELLVEEALKTIRILKKNSTSQLNILDVCTGSGCIALALAQENPNARVYATDVSEGAVACAKNNAEINKINNVIFSHGSLFQPVKGMKFNLIVSNPPYIRTDDMKRLQPEIKNWEPVEALNGGTDGLAYSGRILDEGISFLKPRGCIILELGDHQAKPLMRMSCMRRFSEKEVKKDFSGIKRIFKAYL
jgi:release factor glutamine methyltransferase